MIKEIQDSRQWNTFTIINDRVNRFAEVIIVVNIISPLGNFWTFPLFSSSSSCRVRFLSGGGNNGLIFQRFTRRAEKYRWKRRIGEEAERHLSFIAWIDARVFHSPVLPTRPTSFQIFDTLPFSLSCCRHRFPDTVTKHAAPCNAGAHLYNCCLTVLCRGRGGDAGMKGSHDALQGRSSKTLDSNLDYPSWRDILGNERFFAKDSFYKSCSDYIKNIDREKVFLPENISNYYRNSTRWKRKRIFFRLLLSSKIENLFKKTPHRVYYYISNDITRERKNFAANPLPTACSRLVSGHVFASYALPCVQCTVRT